jgi:hypothetical protein
VNELSLYTITLEAQLRDRQKKSLKGLVLIEMYLHHDSSFGHPVQQFIPKKSTG